MSEKIIIGCKLPHGLMLHDPLDKTRKTKVRLNGVKDSPIKGATFSTTHVDKDFWLVWKNAYPDYAPLKSGAIFEAGSQSHADAMGAERAKEKTGFEGLNPADYKVKTMTAEKE